MSDIDQVLTAVMCNHTAAHHGVAGSPETRGCDECGATWTEIQPDVEPAPTNPSGGAVTSTPAPSGDTNSIVELDRREAVVQTIRGVLYTTPYADLGWRPEPGRFATDDEASEHLARLIAEWVSR